MVEFITLEIKPHILKHKNVLIILTIKWYLNYFKILKNLLINNFNSTTKKIKVVKMCLVLVTYSIRGNQKAKLKIIKNWSFRIK